MTEPEEHAHTNRLAQSSSPYLLQHAHNPVDWHPWGEEAFAKARREDKPIFLSIGYSTCHWCHVMEHESFEDEAIAAFLNEHFVCVKVDREERPDVDAVYMEAVQAMTGSGGWPLSVWLTPDRRPFFGGTYFPPEDRLGRPGFQTILQRVSDAWATQREEIVADARQFVERLDARDRPQEAAALDAKLLGLAVTRFEGNHDPENGGFGFAPKFPRAFALSFLLAQAARGDERALPMVERTLDRMRRGGLHDHLGGGFHRYSTDARWLVPHFEKELYDGALPSGNSAAARLLLRVGHLTMDQDLLRAGEAILAHWSGTIAQSPVSYPYALLAVDLLVGPMREVGVAGPAGDAATQALLAQVRGRFLPRTVLLLHPSGEAGAEVAALAPFVAGQGPVEGRPAAYVCEGFTCQLPVTDPAALARLLSPPDTGPEER